MYFLYFVAGFVFGALMQKSHDDMSKLHDRIKSLYGDILHDVVDRAEEK